MLRDSNQEVPDWLESMSGGRSSNFNRNSEDLRHNPHYRQSGAPMSKGKYILAFIIFRNLRFFDMYVYVKN